MDSHVPGHSGLLGSLRGFADGLVGTVQDRLELFSVELHEEKHRLIQVFIWISAIIILALLAVIFASFALIVIFWDTARVAVIAVLAGLYAVGLVATLLGFRRFLERQPKPFAGTLAEFREDRTCIREDN